MGVEWRNSKSIKEIREEEKRQQIADALIAKMVDEVIAKEEINTNTPPEIPQDPIITSEDENPSEEVEVEPVEEVIETIPESEE